MIGLGRMGANMVRRLMRFGHECVVFDMNPESVQRLVAEGALGAASLDEFTGKLFRLRSTWIMVPAGEPTEHAVNDPAARLEAGDAIIDGYSYYKDDVQRARTVKSKGIDYVDAGTSGSVWGLERGYCSMIGGPAEVVARLDPIFKALATGPGSIAPTPGREKRKSRQEDTFGEKVLSAMRNKFGGHFERPSGG